MAIYVQIENQIKFAIASGKLKPGDKIAAIRDTATAVGVNINTVAKAYRDLEMLGLIYGRRGVGIFVNKDVQAKCQELCFAQIARRLHAVAQEAKAANWKKSDLAQVVNASYPKASGPYDEVPRDVMALAR